MDKWLAAALDYIPDWIELQLRLAEQPGCVIAIAYKGRIVLERAFGVADLGGGERMTPRHRFRAAREHRRDAHLALAFAIAGCELELGCERALVAGAGRGSVPLSAVSARRRR